MKGISLLKQKTYADNPMLTAAIIYPKKTKGDVQGLIFAYLATFVNTTNMERD